VDARSLFEIKDAASFISNKRRASFIREKTVVLVSFQRKNEKQKGSFEACSRISFFEVVEVITFRFVQENAFLSAQLMILVNFSQDFKKTFFGDVS
jgi:hypothetical protein